MSLARALVLPSKKGDAVPQGNFRDIPVVASRSVGNIQPAYMSIVNGGDDAICISAITITAPDSTKISWSGDLGAKCGATFFESNNVIFEGYAPKCIWIDGDGSNGLKHQGFGMHLPDFFSRPAQTQSYNDNSDILCKSGPRFRMYEKIRPEDPILTFDPIPKYNENGTDADLSKIIGNPGKPADRDEGALRKVCENENTRQEVPCSRCVGIPFPGRGVPCGTKVKNTRRNLTFQQPTPWLNTSSTPQIQPSVDNPVVTPQQPSWRWHGKVIISHMTGQSAEGLCKSENSWGPDFVAMREGKFCSMKRKILHDVCSAGKTLAASMSLNGRCVSCFGQVLGLGTVASNATTVYDDIQEWT